MLLGPLSEETRTVLQAMMSTLAGSFNSLQEALKARDDNSISAQPPTQSIPNSDDEAHERARSIVIIGLPEQQSSVPSERVQGDRKLVTDVLDRLGVENSPVSIYRMGRPPNPASKGPRLVKIIFSASRFQHHCLGGWKRVRQQIRATPGLNRLIIRPSMTKEAREAEKMVRARNTQNPGQDARNSTEQQSKN
uniref:Uncharacterized protein n=1 Tax=Globodera rostochiensis TaxID=31243 RepID=A0A914H8U7_GLORO